MTTTTARTGAPPLAVGKFRGDAAEWDAFVAMCEEGSFCHLAAWREVFTDVLGHECLLREAIDDEGRRQGVLPLVRVRSRLFGHYLVSLPFLNYGGPLGTAGARSLLAADAVALAQRSGAELLELRTRFAPLEGLRTSERKVTVLLELPETAEALWTEGLRPKLRSQIRRPQKEGMTTRFGADQVEAFYEVFSRNMRDLGTPVLPRRLFERIARVFGPTAAFGVVYLGSEPVAAGCGFFWNREFEMTWASSLRRHNAKAPNMLLYWAFMEEAIRRGMAVFNFGRCTPGGGTHRFKLQWGGVDRPLPWGQWSPGAVGQTPSPDQGAYRLAVRAWQRLPLVVANALGPVLSRSIP